MKVSILTENRTSKGKFLAEHGLSVFIEYNGMSKTEHYKLIQELANRFKEENNSIICRDLLGLGAGADKPVPELRTDEYYKKRPCVELVGCAAKIMEEYINSKEEK